MYTNHYAAASNPQRGLIYNDAQSNYFSQPSKSITSPPHSFINHTEPLIDTLSEVNDVTSLVQRLNAPPDNTHQEKTDQRNKILWSLAAEMVSAFLKYNFISASTIIEIVQLKPFMCEALWQKVDNKFQEVLHLSIQRTYTLIKNKGIEIVIFASLKSLDIFTRYIKYFSQQENNTIKIIDFLNDSTKHIKLNNSWLQREFHILASKILIDVFVYNAECKFQLNYSQRPLKNLFDHFSSLENTYDPYISYRASYTCQALISIYKSANFNKNKDDSSELAKHEQSSWHLNLEKIRNIKFAEISDLENIINNLTLSERKLFLWGACDILINEALAINVKNTIKEKIFKFLEKILTKDKFLISWQASFFNNVTLPTEDNFFWNDILIARQREVLNIWIIDTLFKPDNSPAQFISNFEKLLSNPIFNTPPAFNYLTEHAKKTVIKNHKQKIYSQKQLHELGIGASPFRFFRRMKEATRSNMRNIASIKYVKNDMDRRQVVYLIAQSMAVRQEEKKVILPKHVASGTVWGPGRSHSEAVLLAANEIGHIYREGKSVLSLAGFKKEYCASIHEPCPEWLEGCQTDLLPSLAPMLYANEYKGQRYSEGFLDKLDAHKKKKDEDEFYESEPESETEYEALVLNEKYFEGMDLTSQQTQAQPRLVPARHFSESFTESLESSSENFFSGYAPYDKHSNEISMIKREGRIVKLGIKTKVNQEDEIERLASAMAVSAKI